VNNDNLKAFFSRFLLRVCKLFFGQTLNPRPRFSGEFSQKVTGGGYGQGFQVANEETGGGETLRRLAIAFY
jgi:putative salt-induced outer membrane protein YdiY